MQDMKALVEIDRLQKAIDWALVASCFGHVFCCVLPTVSTLLGLGASLGLTTQGFFAHDWFHAHEEMILAFAAGLLLVSAVAQFISWQIDCRKTGCDHPPCTPKKRRSMKYFALACGLFALNLAFFLFSGGH